MARTKQEIESQLKDFYKRLRQRMKDADVFDEYDTSEEFTVTGDYDYEVIVYIPEAVYDLLPEWEEGWEGCDYVNSYGVGFLSVEGEDPDEQANEMYGVDSVDELNDIYYKRFYSFNPPEDYAFWDAFDKDIEGKTGLPNERVEIEG